MRRVLVVDDDVAMLRTLRRELGREYETLAANDVAQALSLFDDDLDAVVSDFALGAGGSGAHVLEAVRLRLPRCGRVLVSGSARSELGAALSLAHTFVAKPWKNGEVRAAVRAAIIAAEPQIVVVEDDRDIRKEVVGALEDEGFAVFATGNGKRGLKLLTAMHECAVAIVDLHMPEMDGLELIARLRADKNFENTPIIAMTAFQLDEVPGANLLLRKPFTYEALIDGVKRFIAPRAA